jgi:hypothetical protein
MLEVAARRFGFAPKVSLSPDASDPDLLARIALPPADAPQGQPSKHFDAIMERRTARAAFLPDTPPEALIQTCTALSAKHSVEFSVVSDLSDRQAIAKLVGEGDQIQFDDPSFRRELAAWVHSARLGSKDGMSGASFGMPDVLSAVGRFVIRTFDLGNGIAAADEDKITSATPMLGLFSSAADDQDAWLNTGRALSAVLLEVTAEGFTASYLNQPIETRSLRGKLAKTARITGQPQILIRLGKTHSRFAPTVRRDVADILI